MAPSRPLAYCVADPELLPGREFRADNVRRIECRATMTISPAPPLSTLGFKGSIQAYAPGAGTVTAAPVGGKQRVWAAALLAKAAAFMPTSATATEAGPVTLKLKLSKASKKKLKRKGKLKLSVALEFTPATGGDPIARTTRVTLTKPGKKRR